MKYAVFAKHLQAIPLEQAAPRVRQAGFEGLDLTVRQGGYVDPNHPDFEANLCDAVRLTRAAGLEIPLFTTSITCLLDPAAETTLKLAGDLGIPMIKLGYWPCPAGISFPKAFVSAQRDLAVLAEVAKQTGVKLLLHNHSGDHLTCLPEVVAALVSEHDPAVVGAYLDPAHFTLEGGVSGWRFALEAVLPRVAMVALKDGKFIDPPAGKGPQQRPQQRRWVPIGTGNVRWTDVYAMLYAAGYTGWGSVHGEYQGQWSWKDLTADEVLNQCQADRGFLEQVETETQKSP